MKLTNRRAPIKAGLATRFGADWPGRRCGAKTRSGGTCQNPTIKGRSRCKLHGGRSTGPQQAVGLKPLVWKSPDWHPVSIDGNEFKTLEEAAKFFEQPANRVRNRINKGWSVDRALKTPKVELSKEIVIKGQSYKSIRSAGKALGIHHDTLRKRINSGRDPLTGR